MKFWQKTFLGFLTVFIISINICVYLTSQYSFSINVKRDTNRALGEYHFIINGVYEAMNSIDYRDQAGLTQSSVDSLMRSYADYYKKQGVFLELRHSGSLFFTNIPSEITPGINQIDLSSDDYQVKILPGSGKNYLFITGKVSGRYNDYSLSYARDLSELYQTHSLLTRYLITVSVLVEIALALILLLLSRELTHPIRLMQQAANKIAGGVYNERISIPGKDEFHDLAENFNSMAFSIQEKISELDKNAQDKQRLIDNLAHELRTPLTSIRGYAEYLQNANTNEQNRIKAAGYIISETDRMKNLAFKLLDLTLVRNGKIDLQPIRPSELFSRVKSAVESHLKEKSVTLRIGSSLDELNGDMVLLESLLVNLIENALKASDNGSEIQLSAYFDTVAILEVKDFGYGMEEEQVALVTEPFYRVDKARSRSSGGVGLGLPLCREIANLHGAELRICSSPEKGTTVQVAFTTSLQPSENFLTDKEV